MNPTAPDWPAAAPSAPPPPPPPPHARRRGWLLVPAAAVSALIVGGAVGLGIGLLTRGSASTPSSSASLSPSPASAAVVHARSLYRQALATANASPGFHYVAVTSGGGVNQRFVGDAGQSGGTQAITTASTYGEEQFSLVLVSGTVYFQGNGPALRDQLGVPAVNTAGLAGRWISISSGDGPYGIVAPGITVADQVQETLLVPTSAQTTAGGDVRILGTVAGSRGSSDGTGHLDVAAESHLPTAYVVSISGGGGTTTTSTTTFSKWGTAPTVAAPAGAVAWSTLRASAPPGGYGSGGVGTSPTPPA